MAKTTNNKTNRESFNFGEYDKICNGVHLA